MISLLPTFSLSCFLLLDIPTQNILDSGCSFIEYIIYVRQHAKCCVQSFKNELEDLLRSFKICTAIWTMFYSRVFMLSHVSCVQLFATPWTVAHQAPLPMGFSRLEYCSGLPRPPPGDLPNLGIELWSAWQVDSLPLAPPGKPNFTHSLKPNKLSGNANNNARFCSSYRCHLWKQEEYFL